jgi:hypothetical protein
MERDNCVCLRGLSREPTTLTHVTFLGVRASLTSSDLALREFGADVWISIPLSSGVNRGDG